MLSFYDNLDNLNKVFYETHQTWYFSSPPYKEYTPTFKLQQTIIYEWLILTQYS